MYSREMRIIGSKIIFSFNGWGFFVSDICPAVLLLKSESEAYKPLKIQQACKDISAS